MSAAATRAPVASGPIRAAGRGQARGMERDLAPGPVQVVEPARGLVTAPGPGREPVRARATELELASGPAPAREGPALARAAPGTEPVASARGPAPARALLIPTAARARAAAGPGNWP